jgi:hypothetical protein
VIAGDISLMYGVRIKSGKDKKMLASPVEFL